MKKRIIAGSLAAVLVLLSLSGCGTTARAAEDLMSGVSASDVGDEADLTGGDSGAIANFAVSLFQNSVAAGDNALISPVSVLCALAMTANGAGGETLSQMEAVFGLSVPALNAYIHAYMESLPSGEKNRVSLANSIWVKDDDGLMVKPDFLQTNANYYGASVYKAAFDEDTLDAINNWVGENTGGMIDSILDSIPEEAVMYLINAVAFDAEWENIYTEDEVRDGTFTTESGETRAVQMMYSDEGKYLDDGNATGFLKYYADGEYAFVALLPNEGESLSDYISSLTGEGLLDTIRNAQDFKVEAAVPKFQDEYSVEMSDILKSMGMTDAFNGGLADFSGLGASESGNIFISRVIHKAYIAVDEKGTKAGAATAVEMSLTSAIDPSEVKTVYLDRPFVYAIIDCVTDLPVFIGTVTDTGE